jgi:hypothetical protein
MMITSAAESGPPGYGDAPTGNASTLTPTRAGRAAAARRGCGLEPLLLGARSLSRVSTVTSSSSSSLNVTWYRLLATSTFRTTTVHHSPFQIAFACTQGTMRATPKRACTCAHAHARKRKARAHACTRTCVCAQNRARTRKRVYTPSRRRAEDADRRRSRRLRTNGWTSCPGHNQWTQQKAALSGLSVQPPQKAARTPQVFRGSSLKSEVHAHKRVTSHDSSLGGWEVDPGLIRVG